MIFSVIISEKGGAERRESFERAEINIGRVQGNELMLPKGNVSKRHARLVFKDGRFIVADLKSTNGTYVNGRKIVQPTIVREGDKIYIGDFVLRIEAGPGAVGLRGQSGEYNAVPGDIGGMDAPLSSGGPPSVPAGKPRDGILTGEQNAVPEGPSQFPLESDPEEPPAPAIVPGPPRVPRPAASTKPSGSMLAPTALSSMQMGGTSTSAPPPMGTQRPTGSSIPAPPQSPFPPPMFTTPRAAIPPAPVQDRHTSDSGTGPSPAYRAALTTLVERAFEAIDLSAIASGAPVDAQLAARIHTTLNERAAAMKAASLIPEGFATSELIADARRELIDLGPISALLADDDVIEIHVKGHDRVLAFRKSRKPPTHELTFTSEEAVARALRRIARAAGAMIEETGGVFDRRLPEGTRVVAIGPSAGARTQTIMLRKPQKAEASTLDDLVRSGMISRAVATLLSHAMSWRANVLVTGPAGSGTNTLVAALMHNAGTDERVIALQDDDEINGHPNLLSLPASGGGVDAAAIVRAAARMRPDRLVVGSLGGVTAEIISAHGEGVGSVIATARAPTLRQALPRLTAEIMLARPGTTAESARECLAATFDLALEVARLKDGRARLVRVTELRIEAGTLAPRDIFTFSVERTAAGGAIEGSLYPTGAVPALVEDLTTRGATIDAGIFRRAVGK